MIGLFRNDSTVDNRHRYGDLFVIGNGHLGYRGTLEEYRKNERVGLNVVGFYDRYLDKWRESVNVFNPFYASVSYKNKEISDLTENPIRHSLELKYDENVLYRKSSFKRIDIDSTRFVSYLHSGLLGYIYQIKANEGGEYTLKVGIDSDICEINGPHFVSKTYHNQNGVLLVTGVTNERKEVTVALKTIGIDFDYYKLEKSIFYGYKSVHLNKGDVINYKALAQVACSDFEEEINTKMFAKLDEKVFDSYLSNHIEAWKKQFLLSRVIIDGPAEIQEGIDYSVYQLMSIAPHHYVTSIPARGISGQTYKGAIFWDTEVFMLPFYLLTDMECAKKLIQYRINSLCGAKNKAQMLGSKGAFYAWESQEKGYEACSFYNVTDAKTGEPIRTYFIDKQIHISADVVKALFDYIEYSNDKQILYHGGIEMALEVCRFYLNYAKKDSRNNYHLEDVIGPDEYHERINDNYYTNYIVKKIVKESLNWLEILRLESSYRIKRTLAKIDMSEDELGDISNFADKLYLPKQANIIEQFNGFFKLEDILPKELSIRLCDENQYWGQVAMNTRVIKQADVICTLALFSNEFTLSQLKENFNYYEKYTEHGSSLSASMHALVASKIRLNDKAYQYFMKTLLTDLSGESKQYAGGIYIGGTHPASCGGSYLTIFNGFLGAKRTNQSFTFAPSLPDGIKKIEMNYYENNVLKHITATKNEYKIEEVEL